MITNERQYRITSAAARRFEQALTQVENRQAERHPLLQRPMRESIASELQVLRKQLAEYEALRSGRVTVLELDSLEQLPEALIRALIATGLTQKALAERLGLKEQQVQRYEATLYAGVSLKRIQAVAEALGLRIEERVTLPTTGRIQAEP